MQFRRTLGGDAVFLTVCLGSMPAPPLPRARAAPKVGVKLSFCANQKTKAKKPNKRMESVKTGHARDNINADVT